MTTTNAKNADAPANAAMIGLALSAEIFANPNAKTLPVSTKQLRLVLDAFADSIGTAADLRAEMDRAKQEAAEAWRGRNRSEDVTLAANADAIAEVATLRARCERLETALIAVRKLFDDGLVVRDVSRDHEPDWAIRSGLPVTLAVQCMVAALAGEGTK